MTRRFPQKLDKDKELTQKASGQKLCDMMRQYFILR